MESDPSYLLQVEIFLRVLIIWLHLTHLTLLLVIHIWLDKCWEEGIIGFIFEYANSKCSRYTVHVYIHSAFYLKLNNVCARIREVF